MKENFGSDPSTPERAAAFGAEDTARLPEHLIALPGSRWALWRWAALRGAGFPAGEIFKLSSPECAAGADRLIEEEEKVEAAWESALAAIRRELDEGRPGAQAELHRALRELKKGRVPKLEGASPGTKASVDAFAGAYAQSDQAGRDFQESFEAATAALTEAIREKASESRFREAIIWQSRAVLHTGVDTLLDDISSSGYRRTKDVRRREMLVGKYWQRYTMKNDTIGFFGPVGWARLVPQGEAISARPGPQLLAQRNVYLEGWCVDALAEEVGRDEAIKPWAAPRRKPFIHADGKTVRHPRGGAIQLTSREAAAMRLCDGEQPAKEIAARLTGDASLGFEREEDVYAVLDRLRASDLISWQFEVPWTLSPPHDWHIETNLFHRIERIGDAECRDRAMKIFGEVLSARGAVADAAGDSEQLDRAMGELEATFTRLTSVAATRRHGRVYAGRTLLYEDCRRDIEAEIGPAILEELGPPLSLLLTSARWFVSEVAASYLESLRQIYSDLVRASGNPVVDLVGFWPRVQPLLFGEQKRVDEHVLLTLQRRWAEILSIPEGERRVSYSSDRLRAGVSEAFEARQPGWQYARYHSPDLMIAASSIDAIRRGDYQLVMGEFHVGTNTICNKLFVSQHPAPGEILEALDRDMSGPRLVPVPAKDIYTSRDHTLLTSEKDFRLEYSGDVSGVPLEKALPIGSLIIEDGEKGLVVRTRDGRLKFDLIEAFADILSERISNYFKILGPGRHRPRVTIDRLVVSRESWSLPPDEMAFAYEKDEAYRFLEARRWARE
ncbi:MAG TPA: lantibiotic dehydratase, partial [Blastocatellia bacterium]|nr:lantibiotic dehydratase [Blastocatellia bacterium]